MDVVTVEELEGVLEELRTFGTDHQRVEAKRGRRGLPHDLWTSLSAFANTDGGGLILLGVHEDGGRFAVTGLDDPAKVAADLQSACASLDPMLRPTIAHIDHPSGVVISAHIEALPYDRRPAHRDGGDVYTTSYVRVGDADQRMTRDEIDDLLAQRTGTDQSRRVGPDGMQLSHAAVTDCLRVARERSERLAVLKDHEILENLGATRDGVPTVAGLLALGDAPEGRLAAARVQRQRPPLGDGARSDVSRSEGTIPELLTQTMTWLRQSLRTRQVERDGDVFDELELPPVALRETVVNALVHRSLTDGRMQQQVAVTVHPAAVVVTSPGTLPRGLDVASLGIRRTSTPRNPTLARLCEHIPTPSGARVAEMVASGIAEADRACRARGRLPAILVPDHGSVTAVLPRTPVEGDDRLLSAAADILAALVDAALVPAHVGLDLPYAARLLGQPLDRAANALRTATLQRQLERRDRLSGPVWTPASRATPTDDTMLVLLAALADGPRRPIELHAPLGLRSRRAVLSRLEKAIAQGYVAEPEGSPYDPTRTYELTDLGRHQLGPR